MSAAAALECPAMCAAITRPLLQDIKFRTLMSSSKSGDVEFALEGVWWRLQAFFPCIETILQGAEDNSVIGHLRILATIFGLPSEAVTTVTFELVEARLADDTLLDHLASLPTNSPTTRVHALRSTLSAGEARIAIASALSTTGGQGSSRVLPPAQPCHGLTPRHSASCSSNRESAVCCRASRMQTRICRSSV
jgi:hypothetical protein